MDAAARTHELSFHRYYRVLVICTVAIGRSSPMIGAAVAFAVYSQFTPLRTEIVLPALSVFQALRLPFILIPVTNHAWRGSNPPSTSLHAF